VDIRVRVPRESSNRELRPIDLTHVGPIEDQFSASLNDSSKSQLEVLDLLSAEDVELMAEKLTVVLRQACETLMPKKRKFRKSNSW
jgi:hypothetical protein